MLGKQRLEDTGSACDPNSFGNTNVSPALLGRWRLLLVRGGSALVSKKGMLAAQMLKHQNLAASVRQYCGAGGQGFPVAALRPALGDRRSLSAFFGWLHVPWSWRATRVGHIQVVQKFMYNDVIYGKDVSNFIESMSIPKMFHIPKLPRLIVSWGGLFYSWKWKQKS